MNAYDIIIKPILSEKSYGSIPNKKYTFVVDGRATKTQIKAAVEEIFGVDVEKVNTVNVRGKYKKAYVQLKKDSKAIAFFESLA